MRKLFRFDSLGKFEPVTPANRLWRFFIANVGLIIFAFSIYLTMKADLGLAPWNSLHQALSRITGLSYGTVTNGVALLVIVIDLLMHESLGWGTIADAFMVGWAVDFFLWLDPIPTPHSMVVRIIFMVISLLPAGYGQYLYMATALSCGPRDTLFVGLCKRIPKLSAGMTQIMIFVIVTALSFLLKGPIGIGTLVTAVGIGLALDMVCRIMHFDPATAEHESFIGTHKALAEYFRKGRSGK